MSGIDFDRLTAMSLVAFAAGVVSGFMVAVALVF